MTYALFCRKPGDGRPNGNGDGKRTGVPAVSVRITYTAVGLVEDLGAKERGLAYFKDLDKTA